MNSKRTLQLIESEANPVCKKTASLHQRKYRKRYGLFLLEGIRAVQDALKTKLEFEYVLFEDRIFSLQGGQDLMEKWMELESRTYRVSENVMKKISDTQTPQGVIAAIRIPDHDLDSLIENSRFLLLLDRIQDPGNLGTLIRSAEAAGFDAVMLTPDTVDPYSSKCIRAATGAMLYIPVVELYPGNKIITRLKNSGYQVIGTALQNAVPYTDVDFQPPIALIIGNEARGIDATLLSQLDRALTIPMRGSIQSLNAAVAGSVLMFHVTASCFRQ